MRRYVFIGFAILCWMPLLALLAMGVDLGVNMGFHFGYHGELNKVVDTLEAMPEVDAVRGVAYNPDIAIEEVSIGIETAEGRHLELWFDQEDPMRKLSGPVLAEALANRIEQHTAEQRTSQ